MKENVHELMSSFLKKIIYFRNMIRKEKKGNSVEKKWDEISDELREKILASLSERLRKIVTLRQEYHTVEKGVKNLEKEHGIFISVKHYYKTLKWLDYYIDFYCNKEILHDYIQYIFKKIGYFSNGEKKKGFEMFKLIWEKPYLHPIEIAKDIEKHKDLSRLKKKKYDESYPRKVKQIYLQKMRNFAASKFYGDNRLAVYFYKLFYNFDKCVFKNFYSIMKKHPRKFIKIKEKK